MANINKKISLNLLEELIHFNIKSRFEYLPNSFCEEQKKALDIFKKRIFLEEVIEETISFNKTIIWENREKNLNIVNTAEELIEVFKLRSDVYTKINYQKEFPDYIEGLNFDAYDKRSAILYYKKDKKISATTRLIFDKNKNLPSEEKFSFDYMREKYNTIGEISRLIIKNRDNTGLKLEFKYLMQGLYTLFINNKIDITISGIKEEHYKLYSKFGGINREKELENYGNLNTPFLIISWNPKQASKFFKKVFLN